jgi:hypothetical protein
MLTMNKASKKYYKNLKIFLPIHGKIEKQLFNNIFLRLSELNNTNPNITYEEICIELGSPQEIVAEYFYNTDTTYLSQMLRYSHYLRNTFIGFIIILLILSGIRIHYLNQAYETINETNVTHEVETIE